MLKVLTERASGTGLSRELLDEIATIVFDQQKYLHEEYASVLVSGSFNAKTVKLFKQLQHNISMLPPLPLSNLQAAATVQQLLHLHLSADTPISGVEAMGEDQTTTEILSLVSAL